MGLGWMWVWTALNVVSATQVSRADHDILLGVVLGVGFVVLCSVCLYRRHRRRKMFWATTTSSKPGEDHDHKLSWDDVEFCGDEPDYTREPDYARDN